VESWAPWDWSTIKPKIGSIKCEACGRLFGEHSGDEFEACQRACNPPQHFGYDIPDDDFVGQKKDLTKTARERYEEGQKTPCPECGREVGSHSDEEFRKCVEGYRIKKFGK
jgi:hypothetical protein